MPVFEFSFTHAVADDFRTILSQEDLAVQRVANTASDDDDYLCSVKGDEQEKEGIVIDDDIYSSSDESGADDDAMLNLFDTLTNKVMSIWHKHRSKMIHDFKQSGWKLSPNQIIIEDAKEHAKL